jgi:transketolase
MLEIKLIPEKEFQRIRKTEIDRNDQLSLIADMCRANALATVKRAGSGHLGSSFSCLDIVTFLYHYKTLGIISEAQFINLRRIGGTHGHPDLSIPGIEANSGSLGMGISKAKGMAMAKALQGAGGRIFVMTGDGELQEGQIWESLQNAAHQQVSNLWVIVDFNKIQSDKQVQEIITLGDLQNKFSTFGWHVERCNGHDYAELENVFNGLKNIVDKPKVVIADTIKGRGVSFMEGPAALKGGAGLYKWHAGAPDDDTFEAAYNELVEKINHRLEALGLETVSTQLLETREKNRARLKDTAEKVVTAYGEALVEIGAERRDIIVLDADLSADCGLRLFENTYPERFIENGIAEQDMVSTAGGLALHGFLPIVNSFGVFLASRANEQIYNNATEKTKIIYVCHYAGLIPAGPGKSHQSLRDISLFGALPDFTILEPCNAVETKDALRWCVNEARASCMIRLVISPSPTTINLPQTYQFSYGKGAVLGDGIDAVLFGYGPVMLNEALTAAKLLKDKDFSLKIVNLPWLNCIDLNWLAETTGDCTTIFALDNHSIYGGLGDNLLNALMSSDSLRQKRLIKFAIDEFPACGRPPEALAYHGLDGQSLADRILKTMGK